MSTQNLTRLTLILFLTLAMLASSRPGRTESLELELPTEEELVSEWQQADEALGLEAGDELDGSAFQGPVKASFYGVGDGFGGRKTSCGNRMNPRAMTFAHKWIGTNVYQNVETVDRKGRKVIRKKRTRKMPCGQRICFKFNGKMIEGRADDAGPYAGGRTFDLSNGLAKALGYKTDHPLHYKFGPCVEAPAPKKLEDEAPKKTDVAPQATPTPEPKKIIEAPKPSPVPTPDAPAGQVRERIVKIPG